MEKALGHLFIIARSSHFFNKTDFKPYFFKNETKKKKCKIFRIVFLQHRVEVRGPVNKSRIKPGKETWVDHHCSYTSMKCVLGEKPPVR